MLPSVVVRYLPLPAQLGPDHLVPPGAFVMHALELWFEVPDHALHVHEPRVERLHGGPQNDLSACLIADL